MLGKNNIPSGILTSDSTADATDIKLKNRLMQIIKKALGLCRLTNQPYVLFQSTAVNQYRKAIMTEQAQ